MSERAAFVRFGAFLSDMPPCPHEDGWTEWAWNHPQLHREKGSFHMTLEGLPFRQSYEAEPRHLGFTAHVLFYGDTWQPEAYDTAIVRAQTAWEKLRQIAAEDGLTFPPGWLIVSLDGC